MKIHHKNIKIIVGLKVPFLFTTGVVNYSFDVGNEKNKEILEKIKNVFFIQMLGARSFNHLFNYNTNSKRLLLGESIYSLEYESNIKKENILIELRKNDNISFAEENYRIRPIEPPVLIDDKISNIKKNGYPYSTINVNPFIKSQASEKIIIAVMDSGIDYEHNYLRNSLWENPDIEKTFGFNYTIRNGCDFTDVMDDVGHGTHVAGIIAAKSKDARLQGLVSSAKILSFKINPSSKTYVSDIINAFKKILSFGVKLINCSWQVDIKTGKCESKAIKRMLKIVEDNKCTSVFAAGNDGKPIENKFPQNQKNVITVGAINSNEKRWYSSNHSSNYGDEVDIWAPGEQIYATYIGENKNNVKPNQGTSMAAPFVTGAIALLQLKKAPELDVFQIKDLLKQNSTPINIDKGKVSLLNINNTINSN